MKDLRKIIKEEVNKMNHHVSEELLKLSDTFFENGFLVRMYLNKDTIIIMDLKRRESSLSGTYVMGRITDFADEHGLKIKLVASPNYGTPLEKLVTFYQKFGFKIVGDYYGTSSIEMVREDTDYSKEKD